jgi:hypothetical protein
MDPYRVGRLVGEVALEDTRDQKLWGPPKAIKLQDLWVYIPFSQTRMARGSAVVLAPPTRPDTTPMAGWQPPNGMQQDPHSSLKRVNISRGARGEFPQYLAGTMVG